MDLDDQEQRDAWINERWMAMFAASRDSHSLLTSHLDDGVVAQDLGVTIWTADITFPDDQRAGAFSIAMKLGDRENPKLTADEAEYVVAHLIASARKVWRTYGDDRPSVPEAPQG